MQVKKCFIWSQNRYFLLKSKKFKSLQYYTEKTLYTYTKFFTFDINFTTLSYHRLCKILL
jgi:hypothetical protein